MRWETIQLGEVLTIKHGYPFKSQFFSDSGHYLLLTPGNCHASGGLRLKGDNEKYYIGDFSEEFLLQEGDMLVVMTDLIDSAPILGGSFLIAEDNKLLHNQRLGLAQIHDERRIDKTFLYYLFNTYSYRAQVRGSASGATVRHTSPERIKQCRVRIPIDLGCQRKIGATLSAYDALIENNRRRMGLLGESARLLYREWFVCLRFPGHEHTRIINSVPEGWQRKQLGDVIELKYGKALKESDRIEGPFPVYGSSGIVGTHNEALVKGPAIIVGRKGNVGSVYWSEKDCYPIDTVYFIESDQCSFFLFHNLQHQNFISSDAAVPGLNRKYAYSLPIILPSRTIHTRFEEIVSAIYQQVFSLRAMNEKLKQARDLLLPKLMSGEITV
jgi:type I restriction enzyme, S subunit